MTFNVIALVIGILILAAGIYYFSTEKHDPESRKIYGAAIAAGVVVAVFGAVRLFFM